MIKAKIPEYSVKIYTGNPRNTTTDMFTSKKEALAFARWQAVGDFLVHVLHGTNLIAYRDENKNRLTHCN